jgi:proprotein convertase subtilisin/kexin type 5
MICEFCELTCNECLESCEDGNCNSVCILCDEGLAITEEGECVENCLVTDYRTVNSDGLEICLPCSSPCEECENSATECTLCKVGEGYLHESTCVFPCPDGYIVDENEQYCVACESTCLTCSGLTATDCETCEAPRYLEDNMCVEVC